MKKSEEDISQIDAGISRNNQNQRRERVKPNGYEIFRALLIFALITIVAFFQTMDFTEQQKWLQIILIGMQILASGYLGHMVIPKIFKNEELVLFQERMLDSIVAILKSENKDILSFQLRQLVSQIIAKIDQKVTTNYLKQQNQNVRSFFGALEDNAVIDTTRIEEHIQNAIETNQKLLPRTKVENDS